jgi:tetratricopeptide (TPR) repeat protein
MLPIFESAGDGRSIHQVLYLRALDAFSILRMGDSIAPLRQAAQIAEAIGDVHRWERMVSRMAEAAVVGPTPVEEAVAICRDVLERMDGSRFGAASVRSALGLSLALLGEFEEARMLTRSSVAMLEELGQSLAAASQRQVTGDVEILAGDPVAAERELRPSLEVLVAAGNRWSLPSNAARLAHALAMQGRGDEARHFLQMAREASVADDIDAVSRALLAEALVLVHEGRMDDAISLSQDAVALLDPTDEWAAQGDALLALAEVLHGGARTSEAVTAAERALDLYERKGAIALVKKARELLTDWTRLPPARR